MNTLEIIVLVSFIIIVGYLGEYAFLKFRFPDILVLIFIGFLISFFLKLNVQSIIYNYMPVAATISLIIILFEGGVSLDILTLKNVIKESVLMSIINYFTLFILITLSLTYLLNINTSISMLYGSILAAPSVAIVIPMINRSSLDERIRHLYILDATIMDLLSIVVTVSIIEYYPVSLLTVIPITESLLTNIFAQIFLGLIAGIFWVELLRKIGRVELSYMLTLGYLFLIYALSYFLWKNGMITAIVFGIVLGNNLIFRKLLNLKNYAIDENIFKFNKEVVFFMRTVIFVAIGSIFIIHKFNWEILYYLILNIALIYIVQIFVNLLIFKKVPDRFTNYLIPRGLTQVVLGIFVLVSISTISITFIQNISLIVIITNIITSAILYIKK
ncbi:MAG: cation:proton antiporter [Thermoplasmata archaeon]|nr:cation:proton antiporter [Thermoplasmata archaeon]